MPWTQLSLGSGAPAGSGRAPVAVSALLPPGLCPRRVGPGQPRTPLLQAESACVGSCEPRGCPSWVCCRGPGGSSEVDRPLPTLQSCPLCFPMRATVQEGTTHLVGCVLGPQILPELGVGCTLVTKTRSLWEQSQTHRQAVITQVPGWGQPGSRGQGTSVQAEGQLAPEPTVKGMPGTGEQQASV